MRDLLTYWADCANTFDEEQKHYEYARLMRIPRVHFSFDARAKSILDIGGGPVSMLLKTINLVYGAVVDPLMDQHPAWVRARYNTHGIAHSTKSGEEIEANNSFDEVWIYNVLQHVRDPAKVIANARRAAPVLRIFEWVNIPPHEGHPHMLVAEDLDRWIGRLGTVTHLDGANGCYGDAYSNVAT
jgi:SAM-dependent methyltransferase